MINLCRRLAIVLKSIAAFTIIMSLSGCTQTAPMVATSASSTGNSPQHTTKTAFSQFPDIPIPAGTHMNVEKTLVFGSEPWFGQLALITTSNPGLTFDFYRGNLGQHHWQEITSVRAPISVLTYTQGNRILAISIRGNTFGGSEVTLTVSPRGDVKGSPKLLRNDLMPVPVIKTK